MPPYDAPAEDLLRSSSSRLLWRAPLLVPLVVVGSVICGGVLGWVAGVAALALAATLGMRRVFVCAFLCGGVVALSSALRQTRAEEFCAALAQHGAVELQGVVVQQLAYGCVVQSGWLGVRVAVRGDLPWRVGDEVHFVAEQLPVTQPPVEGMFSAERWMLGQGICANLSFLHGEQVGTSRGWYRLARMAEVVRSSLADRLMPPGTQEDPRRQTLCALVLGEKSRAESDTMELFRRGGCLHAFAVSGLHVGLVSGILWVLLRVGRVSPAVGRWVQLVGVGLYVSATGLAVPALRAYLMLAVLLVGMMLRRRASLSNTWCFAALLILILQPWQLFQVGFQLSFAIYAAICLAVRFAMGRQRWFGPDAYLPPRLFTRGERLAVRADTTLRALVVVSLGAWLASLPFSAVHFHVINTSSYLTNIAVAPLLPLVMSCGLLVVFFGTLPLVGPFFHWLALKSAGLLLWMVGLFGALPGAFLPAQAPAPPSASMVLALAYGRNCAVLGNPGVLVGPMQREEDVRRSIEPVIFHSGFSPAVVCGASDPCVAILSRSWPGMQSLPLGLSQPYEFATSAGRYKLYFPPAHIRQSPSAGGACPIVIWEQPGGRRIIYIGNAAASTLESLPVQECRADVLILGYNPQEPVMDAEVLRRFGAGELLLLPSTAQQRPEIFRLPSTRLRRLNQGDLYRLPE